MFKTFPQFSKVTLEDKEEYEGYVKNFPPVSDIAFASNMVWWGTLGGFAAAKLNGNLVLSYWLPGDDEHSGLSLIGTNQTDESICAIFDHMRERGEEPRLVNVPEFVVNSLRYPELFNFRMGRGDDEYLISLARFAHLENMPPYMRFRARRFLRNVGGQQHVELKRLDLGVARNRQLLFDVTAGWPLRGINNIHKLEREVLPTAINHAPVLETQAVGMYIDGQIEAYCLYFLTNDTEHVIISHARVNYDIPYVFDYAVHAFSGYLAGKGHKYINLHADNGSQKMRALKIALKPENFFRKYTLEPAKVVARRGYGLFREP